MRTSVVVFLVFSLAFSLAGSSKSFTEPPSGYTRQMNFFVPEFNYTEYQFDYPKGLFRWDPFGADEIITELIKNETQEHYMWSTSYDGKLTSCGHVDFVAEEVPTRLTSSKTVGVAHIPDPVTGWDLGEGSTVWTDKKGNIRVFSFPDRNIQVLGASPVKGNAFNLPKTCDPEMMWRNGESHGSSIRTDHDGHPNIVGYTREIHNGNN